MRTFSVLLQKEFLQIRRNPFLPKLIIIFPILIILVMPLVTTMDVRNLNIAAVDLDRSSASQRILSHLDASEYLSLIYTTSEYNLALQKLEEGAIDVIVQIPKHFERDMTIAAPEKISIIANAVNATKASIGTQYIVQTIAKTFMELRGEKNAAQMSELVTIQNRFNPTLNYKHFMIPALMVILFILLCGFLPALSIVSEKECGTIEQINVTPTSRTLFTLSKLIPYWIIGLLVLVITMPLAHLFYGLAPAGSIWLIFLSTFIFILGISGFGITAANFSNTMQQVVFVVFFFIMIFILMGGLLTPIDSMPDWAQKITLFLPPRYYINILRSVYLKGTTFVELWHDFAALAGFAVVFNILAAITYKKQA